MNINSITDTISYIPASGPKPLSSDVIFIKDNDTTWIFDVGSNDFSAEQINKISGKKNIVISHFHEDHSTNITRINYDKIFVSPFTKKNIERIFKIELNNCIIVEKPYIQNNICIYPVPSSHCKGCLCLVNYDYAFMGDSTYCLEKRLHHSYNTQLLKAEIDFLQSLNTKYICLDHDPNFIQQREVLIKLHKGIYSRRKPGDPLISVEDFFTQEGTVKPLDEQPHLTD